MGKFIKSKFNGKCAETGKAIYKYELIYFDGCTYCQESTKYKENKEALETLGHVEANENAYFDNFCLSNNI
jgi:RNA polymerase-binding transcription factor DksA